MRVAVVQATKRTSESSHDASMQAEAREKLLDIVWLAEKMADICLELRGDGMESNPCCFGVEGGERLGSHSLRAQAVLRDLVEPGRRHVRAPTHAHRRRQQLYMSLGPEGWTAFRG